MLKPKVIGSCGAIKTAKTSSLPSNNGLKNDQSKSKTNHSIKRSTDDKVIIKNQYSFYSVFYVKTVYFIKFIVYLH